MYIFRLSDTGTENAQREKNYGSPRITEYVFAFVGMTGFKEAVNTLQHKLYHLFLNVTGGHNTTSAWQTSQFSRIIFRLGPTILRQQQHCTQQAYQQPTLAFFNMRRQKQSPETQQK